MRKLEYNRANLASDTNFFEFLLSSYKQLTGEDLMDRSLGPDWLYNNAPFAVVSHNNDSDPRFVYANTKAQSVFGYTWDEFTALPSKLSARSEDRQERQKLLDAVSRDGYCANYEGIRVTKSGELFMMEEGVVWQLVDDFGHYHGQAATFTKWTELYPDRD